MIEFLSKVIIKWILNQEYNSFWDNLCYNPYSQSDQQL